MHPTADPPEKASSEPFVKEHATTCQMPYTDRKEETDPTLIASLTTDRTEPFSTDQRTTEKQYEAETSPNIIH